MYKKIPECGKEFRKENHYGDDKSQVFDMYELEVKVKKAVEEKKKIIEAINNLLPNSKLL